ncbi:U6 snRNA phosphodiesterase isoform X2 [Pieris rapae]|uniref:U6 snRNA phosphodiesterase isoform X2 n=1 Tax=Pieris rapae TaxID=64459 RepID=UPI001E27AD07|nr:U6 snRNA phosphodiesterase isoform X2 [Pieris rapae]
MSGLSYLCDYGDSEESETEESRITVKEKSKLPVPNLTKVTVCPPDSYCDDPRQHHGRLRTFPHIRGPDESAILDLLCKIKFVFKTIDETCYPCDNLHISVTKTVVLKYHLITSFTTSLQEIISGIETFELGFDTIEVYTNEEKTRTFVALKADHLSRKFLLRIVEKVDNVLEDYNLPTFYKEPSFHMSILWWKGDLKDAILKHIDELNTILAQEKEVYKKFCIQKVDCKLGNKYYQFHLD